MLSVQPRPPVDYSKCDQTVTVYHQNTDKSVTRTVYEKKAFLDFRKNQSINKTGATETNSFLLVIPGAVTLYNGDKAYLGTGPLTITWASYIPATVAGLVVVKYVDPKYWNGTQWHVEAGG